MLIHRGLHGEYGFDVHGFSLLTIGIIPFICVFLLRGIQFRLPVSGLCIVATVLATLPGWFYIIFRVMVSGARNIQALRAKCAQN